MKSGFVAIVGKPNAGKSSLVNKLVGFEVAIITPKPQTTRFNIKGIKASFVLSPNDQKIVISGRSLGDINVQMILEKLGGGGSMTIAGAQVPDSTLEETIEKLKAAIDEYQENIAKG